MYAIRSYYEEEDGKGDQQRILHHLHESDLPHCRVLCEATARDVQSAGKGGDDSCREDNEHDKSEQ